MKFNNSLGISLTAISSIISVTLYVANFDKRITLIEKSSQEIEKRIDLLDANLTKLKPCEDNN